MRERTHRATYLNTWGTKMDLLYPSCSHEKSEACVGHVIIKGLWTPLRSQPAYDERFNLVSPFITYHLIGGKEHEWLFGNFPSSAIPFRIRWSPFWMGSRISDPIAISAEFTWHMDGELRTLDFPCVSGSLRIMYSGFYKTPA